MSPVNQLEIPDEFGATGDVARLARLRLATSVFPALRRLDCHFDKGMLTIRGRVSTFHERQMAWIVLCDLPGVEEYIDRVDVAGQSTSRQPRAFRSDVQLSRAK
jgi:hypothetical protein